MYNKLEHLVPPYNFQQMLFQKVVYPGADFSASEQSQYQILSGFSFLLYAYDSDGIH